MAKPGLVIEFNQEIEFASVLSVMGPGIPISSEVFSVWGRRVSQEAGQLDLLTEGMLMGLSCEPVEVVAVSAEDLIEDVVPLAPDSPQGRLPRAIRLVGRLPDDVRLPFSYRVQLRCDFIRDRNGQFAVDGNHIFGEVPRRPSGNGLEGGSFESWFGING